MRPRPGWQRDTRFYYLPVRKNSLLFLNNGLLLWEVTKATAISVRMLTERQYSRVVKSLNRGGQAAWLWILTLPLYSCHGAEHSTEPHYFLTLELVRRRVVGRGEGTEETPIWDEKDLPCCFERSLPELTHVSLLGRSCSGFWICVKKIR